MRAFAEGRAAFGIGQTHVMLDVLRNAACPWRARVALPPEPYLAPTGATQVGITAGRDRVAEAGEVVRFLIAPEAQSIIAKQGMNCPIRKDSRAPLAEFLGIKPAAFARHMDRFRLADEPLPRGWTWFLNNCVMPYLNDAIGMARRPDRDELIAYLEAIMPPACIG